MEENIGAKQNVLNNLLWSLEFQHHSILYFTQNEKFIILDALGDKAEAIEKALTCLSNVDKML